MKYFLWIATDLDFRFFSDNNYGTIVFGCAGIEDEKK